MNCPSCGSSLSSVATICPACGSEAIQQSASAERTIDLLNARLSQIDAMIAALPNRKLQSFQEKQRLATSKADIIKTFPVPNDKAVILELLAMASANGEASFLSPDEKVIADAWLAKAKHIYGKAQFFAIRDREYRDMIAPFGERILRADNRRRTQIILVFVVLFGLIALIGFLAWLLK